MLAIRMQRTGRSGHAQFRVIVQEARLTPTSGKVVAYLGNYNPHTKTAALEKEKAAFYLEHGAQPSDRAARLLKKEGVKLPKWVKVEEGTTKRTVRNPDKLRKNRPAEEAAPAAAKEEAAAEPADEVATTEPTAETSTSETGDEAAEETIDATSGSGKPDTAAAEEPADETTA